MARPIAIIAVVLGILAAVVFAVIVGPSVGRRIVAARSPATAAGNIVLTADLTDGLSDGPDPDPLSKLLFNEKSTLRDFVDALERASTDPQVKVLYIQLGDDTLALPKAQQVRDAIRAFRAKGKFAIAFADTFGEGGPGTRPYYLATACDEIWLQNLGELGLTGLRSETPFLRGLLDKLGVAADFEHREEFKTAMNSLTETQMTGPQREEIDALLTSMSTQIDRGIAEARHLSPEAVASAIDRAPLSAEEAQMLGLVTNVGYRDQAESAARLKAGPGAKLMSLSRYLASAGRPHATGSEIALVYGTGMISRGGSGAEGLTSPGGFSAAAVGKALDEAARDKDVRAIIFRIDSPGGSATASETIWRDVQRARQRGKPVIVSMGDVAASGGYYIAAAADKIVAEPATLTGSIGVLAGKIVIGDLLDKLGVTFDAVQRGANAGMSSATERFSPQERQRLNAQLDEVYAGFKNHVAAGRHMKPDAVEAVAKGRVWSGADAKENGLVDALGGYEAALRLAREAAHLPADAPVHVVIFPRQRGIVAILANRLWGADNDDAAAPMGTLQRGFAMLRMLAALAQSTLDDSGVLRMPSIGDIR